MPPDSSGKDLEKGDATTEAAREAPSGARGETGVERGKGEEVGGAGVPHRWYSAPTRWVVPMVSWRHGVTAAKVVGPSPHGEKVVTLVKPYSAEVWVYRCRLAAVVSALMLLIALIVAVVVVGSQNS
jgi:hypothetical protein